MKYDQIHSFLSFNLESVSLKDWEEAVKTAKDLESVVDNVYSKGFLPINEKSTQAEFIAYFSQYTLANQLLYKAKNSKLISSEIASGYIPNCTGFVNVCKTLEGRFAKYANDLNGIVSKINALPTKFILPIDRNAVLNHLANAQSIYSLIASVESNGVVFPEESKNQLNNIVKYYNDCLAPYNPDFNGVATIAWKKGVYEGHVTSGIPNGLGKLTLADGSVYCGKFSSGEMVGEGTYTSSDGSVVFGVFKDGRISNGKITYFNKNTYIGELFDLVPHGKGTLTIQASNAVIEGTFKNGASVDGTVTVKGETVYKGQIALRFDKTAVVGFDYHGKGELFQNDGTRYVGDFKKGYKHGAGILYDKNNAVVYDGDWENDEQKPSNEYKIYLDGIREFRRENWESAHNCFRRIPGFRDARSYADKCKKKIDEAGKADRIRAIFSLILQIIVSAGALVGGYLLISSKDQRWYAPFFAMVIAILPHIISIKMINEKKNQIICRIIQQVVAYAVIITLSLICDFSIFNMIVSLIATAIIENVLPTFDADFERPVFVIIACLISIFGLFFALEYLYPFMIAKSFWHLVWLTPVCLAVILTFFFAAIDKEYEGLSTTGALALYLLAVVRTIVLICSLVGFSFGMFWFIVLVVSVSGIGFGAGLGIGGQIGR